MNPSYEIDPNTGFFVPSSGRTISTISNAPTQSTPASFKNTSQETFEQATKNIRKPLPEIKLNTKKIKRQAAGQVWEDVSLQEWPESIKNINER